MALKLIVTNTFADYEVGAEISDQELVAKYAASHPSSVVKVMADDPAPKSTVSMKPTTPST